MLFGFTEQQLETRKAQFTACEIAQQPETWLKTLELVKAQKDELNAFIGQVTGNSAFDVIMVGAGTSDYVGKSAFEVLSASLPFKVQSCATTDLVVEPEKYIKKGRPTLLVSFARSGNSPESVGAVETADKVSDLVYHLFITCNSQGALAKLAGEKKNCYSLLLPPETNDKGFAMTSSFSCMYLACLFAFRLERLAEAEESVKKLCAAAEQFISEDWTIAEKIAEEYDFERIVYLGTGVRKGIAQEAALKMLELNAGKIGTFFESPLGFRHGPKSIINDRTLTVFFVSNNDYVLRYEKDLLNELIGEKRGNRLLALTSGDEQIESDYFYRLPCAGGLGEEYQALLCIMFAQVFALLVSLKNGIGPDNPCPTGEVNRVVKGVTIYPYPV